MIYQIYNKSIYHCEITHFRVWNKHEKFHVEKWQNSTGRTVLSARCAVNTLQSKTNSEKLKFQV